MKQIKNFLKKLYYYFRYLYSSDQTGGRISSKTAWRLAKLIVEE